MSIDWAVEPLFPGKCHGLQAYFANYGYQGMLHFLGGFLGYFGALSASVTSGMGSLLLCQGDSDITERFDLCRSIYAYGWMAPRGGRRSGLLISMGQGSCSPRQGVELLGVVLTGVCLDSNGESRLGVMGIGPRLPVEKITIDNAPPGLLMLRPLITLPFF